MQIVSQITLNQDDIIAAITAFIAASGVDLGDTPPEIVLVAKKGDVTASVDVSTGVKVALGVGQIEKLNKPTEVMPFAEPAVAKKTPAIAVLPKKAAAKKSEVAPLENTAPAVKKAAVVADNAPLVEEDSDLVEEGADLVPAAGLFVNPGVTAAAPADGNLFGGTAANTPAAAPLTHDISGDDLFGVPKA